MNDERLSLLASLERALERLEALEAILEHIAETHPQAVAQAMVAVAAAKAAV